FQLMQKLTAQLIVLSYRHPGKCITQKVMFKTFVYVFSLPGKNESIITQRVWIFNDWELSMGDGTWDTYI
ncbi:MAG: hypothetical protein AAFX46_02865, partial [Cyanobacteria bacterium J06636_27]